MNSLNALRTVGIKVKEDDRRSLARFLIRQFAVFRGGGQGHGS